MTESESASGSYLQVQLEDIDIDDEGDSKAPPEVNKLSDWSLGIIFLVLVSVIWAASSVVAQSVLGKSDFDDPFDFTYITNAMFVLYFPYHSALVKCKLTENPPLRSPKAGTSKGKLRSHFYLAKSSLFIFPVWFLSSWSYYNSLKNTSVTSNTVISCTSSLWTLLMSTFFKKEKMTSNKGVGVFLALLGGIMIRLADQGEDSGKGTLYGDAMAFVSAICYGIYSTLIVSFFPEDSEVSMPLVFGYLGLFGLISTFPLLFVNRVPFSGLTLHTLSIISLNAVFDSVIADMLWARSVVLTTPTVASVGLALTIPLAFVTDFIFNDLVPNKLEVLGALLVVIGFGAVSLKRNINDFLSRWWVTSA
mmetsp:Transcript_20756/g.30724  ORF Transcript_20756/g.30724 Transcript_20756/m.30724 type:complete len:363 (+) Transcript_20756:48-1136(+)